MPAGWRRSLLLAVLCTGLWRGPALAAEASDPAAFIGTFADQAARIAQEHGGPSEAALAQWRALLHEALDLPAIARFVVGPIAWQRATGEQRGELTALIEARLAEFYAKQVEENAGAALAVTGAEPLGETEWLVTSTLTRAGGSTETIEWRVQRSDGTLRIRDIIADGNSLAAARRTEYGQILQRNGGDPAALIRTLRARAPAPAG